MTAGAAEVAMPATPTDGAALLAKIKPIKRREETFLCLRPDLLDQWHEENEKLGQMRAEELEAGTDRLSATQKKKVSAAVRKQAELVQSLEDQIDETQVRFIVEKMSVPDWSALIAQYPPRADNLIDHHVGYNREAVEVASVRACLIEPVFDEASYKQLLDVLGPSEWGELRDATQKANGKVVSAPKSALAASLLSAPSSSRSRQPRAGE